MCASAGALKHCGSLNTPGSAMKHCTGAIHKALFSLNTPGSAMKHCTGAIHKALFSLNTPGSAMKHCTGAIQQQCKYWCKDLPTKYRHNPSLAKRWITQSSSLGQSDTKIAKSIFSLGRRWCRNASSRCNPINWEAFRAWDVTFPER